MTELINADVAIEKVRKLVEETFGPEVQTVVTRVEDDLYAIRLNAPDGFDFEARIEEFRAIHG